MDGNGSGGEEGDYLAKHILIDGDRISGIIDFEGATGGDPVKDFAYWDFFASDQYPLEALKTGYAEKSLFGSDFEKRLYLWKLHLGLNNLGYYEGDNNQGGIDFCKQRLVADSAYFR